MLTLWRMSQMCNEPLCIFLAVTKGETSAKGMDKYLKSFGFSYSLTHNS